MGALTVLVFWIARRDYLTNKQELLVLYKDIRDDKAILINLVKENIAGITALTKIIENMEDNHTRPYIGPDRRKRE